MKFAFYCRCGGSMTGSANGKGVQEMLAIFLKSHTGEGHGECDAKTAAAARRRAEVACPVREPHSKGRGEGIPNSSE